LGPSNIKGAGRGLFAKEKILEGEVITCYPGDALLYELPSTESVENDDESDFEGYFEDDFDDDEDEDYTEDIVLWGMHVPTEDRWEEDVVFDGSNTKPALTAYAVSVDDHYSVMGHPDLDTDAAYYGHFANDGAGHLALEKPNSQSNLEASLELGLDTEDATYDDDEESIGVEENIAAYVLKSLEVANAMHKPMLENELHMVTVATRDIEEGEEILVTYGPDYWLGHC
jgi:hypothetical protein